jgi:hypothetical protein
MKLDFSVVWDNEEYGKTIIDFMMKNKFPSCRPFFVCFITKNVITDNLKENLDHGS